MRKIVLLIVICFQMLGIFSADVVFAATDPVSVLPKAEPSENCADFDPDMEDLETWLAEADDTTIRTILGSAIKTGKIKLYMVPYFLKSILEFIIGISGIVCVGAIVFGGYSYLFAGISEDKEKGKKAIMYGIIGMILTLVAWAAVNIVISLLTM